MTGMDYIDRKALIDAIYDADAITMNGVKILNQLPSADVAPVRHGKWLEWFPGNCALIMTGEEMLYRCSSCDAKYADAEEYKYCPNCGAKMDLEEV